jgi:dihydrodipicolinate synthase/N-acetylneuraminate lyase
MMDRFERGHALFSIGSILRAYELASARFERTFPGRVRFEALPLFRRMALESSPIPVKYMLLRLGPRKANEHRSPMAPASPESL